MKRFQAELAETVQLSVPVLTYAAGVILLEEPLSLRIFLTSLTGQGGSALALVGSSVEASWVICKCPLLAVSRHCEESLKRDGRLSVYTPLQRGMLGNLTGARGLTPWIQKTGCFNGTFRFRYQTVNWSAWDVWKDRV